MKRTIFIAVISIVSLPSLLFAEKLPIFTAPMIAKVQFGKISTTTRDLQETLNAIGYTIAEEGPGSPGYETGLFDTRLKNAIKNFQTENEIAVTGNFDTNTAKVLNQIVQYYNSAIDEEAGPIEDATDKYSADLEMNKEYFDKDTKDVLSYVGNALDSYAGINIMGGIQESNDSKALFLNPDTLSESGVVNSSVTNSTPKSGNFFQDLMIKGIISTAANYIYETFSGTSYNEVTYSQPNIDRYSREEINTTIKNVTTDGKFDPFKCLQDPICSKF